MLQIPRNSGLRDKGLLVLGPRTVPDICDLFRNVLIYKDYMAPIYQRNLRYIQSLLVKRALKVKSAFLVEALISVFGLLNVRAEDFPELLKFCS